MQYPVIERVNICYYREYGSIIIDDHLLEEYMEWFEENLIFGIPMDMDTARELAAWYIDTQCVFQKTAAEFGFGEYDDKYLGTQEVEFERLSTTCPTRRLTLCDTFAQFVEKVATVKIPEWKSEFVTEIDHTFNYYVDGYKEN